MTDNLIEKPTSADGAIGRPGLIGVTRHIASDGCARLAVAGELDAASASTLIGAVINTMDAGSVHVELDMRDVTFIDSAGLGALIRAYKAAQGRGSLVICELSDVVHRLLAITGQLERFTTAPPADQEWK